MKSIFKPLVVAALLGSMTLPQESLAQSFAGSNVGINLTLGGAANKMANGQYLGFAGAAYATVNINNTSGQAFQPSNCPTAYCAPLPGVYNDYYVKILLPAAIKFSSHQNEWDLLFTNPNWSYEIVGDQEVRLRPTAPFASGLVNSVQLIMPIYLITSGTNMPFTVSAVATGLPYQGVFDHASSSAAIAPGYVTILDQSLSVDIANFSAKDENCQSVLSWTMAKEENTSHFVVERSADGKFFLPIGEVKGAGNSSDATGYSFVDREPINGHNFYRLSQFDVEGAFTYSAVERTNIKCNEDYIEMYPNPAENGIVYIKGLKDNATIEVYNALGQVVVSKQTSNPVEGLNISRLAAGAYSVKIVRQDATIFNSNLIVK